MAFTLEKVVPWGRSLEEYRRMFALSEADLEKRILGCSDGPASFNAELTAQGGSVVSLDPLYAFGREGIARQIEATFETVMAQTEQHKDTFVWQTIGSVSELKRVRRQAMDAFLDDYPQGKAAGRYLEGSLPVLPFADQRFDLALCSHFLFLYSEPFDEAFHAQALLELCRVAGEVRVFPLLNLAGEPSLHVEPVTAFLRERKLEVSLETVPYEFKCGAYQMLRVRS